MAIKINAGDGKKLRAETLVGALCLGKRVPPIWDMIEDGVLV